MQNLFVTAVESCKVANSLTNELAELDTRRDQVATETVSAVEVACAESYAWFISVNRKHGAKAELSRESGVSEKTIGRWLASGHVALVTDGKITASEVNSAIGNYNMKTTDIDKVKSVTDWRELLKAYKATHKAGKAKAKATEPTEPTSKPVKAQDWETVANQLADMIMSGEVELQVVAEYITSLVADKSMALV